MVAFALASLMIGLQLREVRLRQAGQHRPWQRWALVLLGLGLAWMYAHGAFNE